MYSLCLLPQLEWTPNVKNNLVLCFSMPCAFKIRAKENSNRGEIPFCYKFLLTKGKKFFWKRQLKEKKFETVRKKRPCRNKIKTKSDRGLLGKLE